MHEASSSIQLSRLSDVLSVDTTFKSSGRGIMDHAGDACLYPVHAVATRGAAAEESSAQPALPDQVIREVTEQVMQVVSEANTYFDEEPERYYREIDAALAALVDWRGFATAVMGDYYSRGRSMDSAGRTNLKRQRDEFAETLREGLIRSYAKGLLALVARKWRFRVLRPRHKVPASRLSHSSFMAKRIGSTRFAIKWANTKTVPGACAI